MFDLVADVKKYPEFVPLCSALTVKSRNEKDDGTIVLVADMTVAYKIIRETFTSRVTLDRPSLRIDVDYLQGPFKTLKNHWTFSATQNGQCQIDFHLEFEFSSVLLQKLIGVLFHEAVRRMVAAFEARAYQLYTPIS